MYIYIYIRYAANLGQGQIISPVRQNGPSLFLYIKKENNFNQISPSVIVLSCTIYRKEKIFS